jgi:hypothetical protein
MAALPKDVFGKAFACLVQQLRSHREVELRADDVNVAPNPHVRTAAATLAGFSARNFVGALLAARIM